MIVARHAFTRAVWAITRSIMFGAAASRRLEDSRDTLDTNRRHVSSRFNGQLDTMAARISSISVEGYSNWLTRGRRDKQFK